MIQIADLYVPLIYDNSMLLRLAAERLSISLESIEKISIEKRCVFKRNAQDICFKMTLFVYLYPCENEDTVIWNRINKSITRGALLPYQIVQKSNFKLPPVIIGAGPAGLFAALLLAEAGANPILLERGEPIEDRRLRVKAFWESGLLDPDSNVAFGEGGAGTFSDGKLKLGKKDERKRFILQTFVNAGAPEEILWDEKPHIGTDRLHIIVRKMRERILSLGGQIHFRAQLTDILQYNNAVTGAVYMESNVRREIRTDNLILAIGHSARDTIEHLFASGIQMQPKPFAVGVRIEHPQSLINELCYGSFAGHPALGSADYKMVVHLPDLRNVYTFCMCPGGNVVAAASEPKRLVTNGMSHSLRNGENANSAILVTLKDSDFPQDHPLSGIRFQREIESAAFLSGGQNYYAPVQRLEDFLAQRNTKRFGDLLPTYRPGTRFASVESYLPPRIADALRDGIREMCAWMPGYYHPDALITGAETRSSSTVRITRMENLESPSLRGLYPCGEGAGYAGGIMSAAVDGLLCAEIMLAKNA